MNSVPNKVYEEAAINDAVKLLKDKVLLVKIDGKWVLLDD